MKTELLVLWLFSSTTVFADVKVKMHFSLIANLVYQLDCISNEIPHCSKATYQNLWRNSFFTNPGEDALVRSWGYLMSRYHPVLKLQEHSTRNISDRFEGVKLSTKIRIASFQSETMKDYFDRLDLVVTPKDRERLENVVRHFYPKFEKWWVKVAQPKGKNFARQTDSLLNRPDIAKKIRQFASFYDLKFLNSYMIHLNLFYRPDFDEATSGEQIENYSMVEFLPSESPLERIDVILHELCHFFSEHGTEENFTALQKAFDNIGKIESKGAYNLIKEGLPTALGNGLINKLTMDKERWDRYSTKPLSFYNNYFVDRTAKSILPLLEEWLNDERTLYDPQFVEKYISILEETFGNELTTPKLLLNELVLFVDGKFGGDFRDLVHHSLRASSVYRSEGELLDEKNLKSYTEKANLSALLIVHSSNIGQLKERKILMDSDYAQLYKEVKDKGQAILSFKRSQSAPGYVIVAPSYETALKLVDKLAELKEGFSGFLRL